VIPDDGGIQCANFLEMTLFLLLENVPFNFGEGMWFQHDGTLATLYAKCIIC
jgi:hypothetical protein